MTTPLRKIPELQKITVALARISKANETGVYGLGYLSAVDFLNKKKIPYPHKKK